MRDADVYNGPGLVITNLVLTITPPDSDAVVVSSWYSAGEDSAFLGTWRGRQVVNEGETIAFVANSGLWDVSLSGYLLTTPTGPTATGP